MARGEPRALLRELWSGDANQSAELQEAIVRQHDGRSYRAKERCPAKNWFSNEVVLVIRRRPPRKAPIECRLWVFPSALSLGTNAVRKNGQSVQLAPNSIVFFPPNVVAI